jgi:undecaprenyl diphosphate synthase
LPQAALREIEKAEAATEAGQRLHLCVAIDYSSRHAIADAAASLPNWLSAPELLRRLLTEKLNADGGQVDLLIRTGGEKRLSDFLLWESAYAELLFTDRMWPDFDETDLEEALEEFRRRDRRFGRVTAVPRAAQHATHPAA